MKICSKNICYQPKDFKMKKKSRQIWHYENSIYVFHKFFVGKPQFIDKSPNVHPGIYQRWEFNIKAYTNVVDKCILASLSAGENWRKEVNCTLTGDPPNLKLTVVILNDSITGENWSLNISIEGGLSETLFSTLPLGEYSYVRFFWVN